MENCEGTLLRFKTVERLTPFQHVLSPQGTWLTGEVKTLKGGIIPAAGNQQSKICIALAFTPNIIIANKPEDIMALCCGDQHGMLSVDFGFCASSENEKVWSAS